MTKEEIYNQLENACDEIETMIAQATERGQFNIAYFRKPFMQWYVKQWDKKKK
jgi:hypothetical protein